MLRGASDCRYFWTYNSGLQAQAVLQTQANLEEDPQLLLDPNKLSNDGTVGPLHQMTIATHAFEQHQHQSFLSWYIAGCLHVKVIYR